MYFDPTMVLLFSGLLLGLCGRCSRGKDLLQRSDLIALGHNVKEHIQLLLGQNLLCASGLFKKLGDQVGDRLGGNTEVLGHFADAILDKTTQYSHLHVVNSLRTRFVRTARHIAAVGSEGGVEPDAFA